VKAAQLGLGPSRVASPRATSATSSRSSRPWPTVNRPRRLDETSRDRSQW